MGCEPSEVDLYGSVKAKINLSVRDRLKDTENGYVRVCVQFLPKTGSLFVVPPS